MRSARGRSTMTDDILVTENLTKSFGDFRAVSGVNLNVRRGSIHALIGPNGAGKTTCFNMLTKFIRPSAGTIVYKGQRHHGDAAGRRGAARPRAVLPDLGGLSASDGARKRARRAAAPARRQFRFLALEERAEQPQRPGARAARRRRPRRTSRTTSPARSPMAASARWKSPRPSRSSPKCCCSTSRWPAWGTRTSTASSQLIRRVSANRTVLMVEHNLQVVAHLSDRITVLTRGRVLAEGDYATVSENAEVKQAYMGVGDG